MSRLTKLDKYGNPYTNENINCRNLVSEDGINYKYVGYVDNFKAFDGKPIDKLSKLEDFEDELGISLEVLFNALKEGVYWKTYQDKAEHSYMGLFEAQTGGFYLGDDEYNDVFTKEYGVTWALTKEELE